MSASQVATEKAREPHSHISNSEYEFLASIIRGNKEIKRTVEIGCAFGVSAGCICGETADREGAHHMIFDPYQTSRWNCEGVNSLKERGYSHFTLREEFSEIGLPKMLPEYEGKIDLVFIDGWHTFDQTLVDCYFANRLLRVGGIMMIDDFKMPGVERAVRYIERYPCYERYGQTGHQSSWWKLLASTAIRAVIPEQVHVKLTRAGIPSMVALKKTAIDERPWDWDQTLR